MTGVWPAGGVQYQKPLLLVCWDRGQQAVAACLSIPRPNNSSAQN